MTIKDRRYNFIKKSKITHNNKYIYDKVEYVNTMTKVEIICPIHGSFKQIPNNHIRGQGCPKCKKDKLSYTTNKYIIKAKKVHGDKYDYSKTNYIGSNEKVNIICPTHGNFKQIAYLHLSGSGCPKCAKNNKYTIDDFISKSKLVHGDKYDYSLVNYISNNTKVKIICPIHGIFEQQPVLHYSGHGCTNCAIDNLKNKDFIQKSINKHGNIYDYSLVNYINHKTKVKIICPIHGMFEQLPYVHLRGSKCNKCVNEHKMSNADIFINKADLIHKGFYIYDKINYTGSNNKIIIKCPIHGDFEQIPFNHLKGHGCPKCTISISKGAEEINEFITNLGFKTEENTRSIIKPLELDIFIKDRKLAIEFNGLYYHSYSKNELPEEKNKHAYKTELCLNHDIFLLQIFENEWYDKQDIVKSIVKSKLNIADEIIYGRNCKIEELSNDSFNNFCELNHIQGKINTNIKLGLIFKSKIVSVMGFNKHNKYDYECTRFCNKINTKVIGGASKLFKHFLRSYQPTSILSYSDRRYFNGKVYDKIGFNLDTITKPGYFYTKGKKIYSRHKFQKRKLKDKLVIYNDELSESENMFLNGYRRIWDCGHYKYIYKNSNINYV